MADLDAVGALAEGMRQGLLTYRDVKKSNFDEDQKIKEQALRDRMLKFQMAEKGMQDLDGEITLTPGAIESQKWERGMKLGEMQAKGLKPMKGMEQYQMFENDKDVDPEKQAKINLLKAQAMALRNKSSAQNIDKEDLSPGQLALDKTYAKDYVEWTDTGRPSLEKNLQKLEGAAGLLKQDPSLTGSLRGLLPDAVRNITNPKAMETKQAVRGAVMGSLRSTMGAAFTEKEGENFFKATYDDRLSPQANIEKINAQAKELRQQSQEKNKKALYFEKHGTLRGYESNASGLDQKDAQAIEWARKNSNDPKAKKILMLNQGA